MMIVILDFLHSIFEDRFETGYSWMRLYLGLQPLLTGTYLTLESARDAEWAKLARRRERTPAKMDSSSLDIVDGEDSEDGKRSVFRLISSVCF